MKSENRGNEIFFSILKQEWLYVDNNSSVGDNCKTRACGRCGKHRTPEGHDACLGTLPGVKNACCGYGVEDDAYVQFLDGSTVTGELARAIHTQMKTKRDMNTCA